MHAEEQRPDDKVGRLRFVRFGILAWGLPMALFTAIPGHWERTGGSLSAFLSLHFVLSLLASLLLFGLIGGWLWGRAMWWAFNRLGGIARWKGD
jgi:hypothetical protein